MFVTGTRYQNTSPAVTPADWTRGLTGVDPDCRLSANGYFKPRATSTMCSAVMPSSFITSEPGADRPKRSMPIATPSRPT
jgi:hypothetical protein